MVRDDRELRVFTMNQLREGNGWDPLPHPEGNVLVLSGRHGKATDYELTNPDGSVQDDVPLGRVVCAHHLVGPLVEEILADDELLRKLAVAFARAQLRLEAADGDNT